MTIVGVADAPADRLVTDGAGGADTPPPTPNGMVGVPLVEALAVALSPANSGRLVVKEG